MDSVAGFISGLFDWDNPSSLAPIHRFVQRSCPDMAHTHGLDQGLVLARQPARTPLALPGLSSMPPEADEMDLATAASVPALIHAPYQFTSSASPGNIIARLPVNPRYCASDWDTTIVASGCKRYYPTPAAMVSLPFAMWRGTMRYQVHFICSSFHTARVKVSFVPRLNASAGVPAPVDSMSQVVEINGPCKFEFAVPFIWHRPYAEQATGTVVFTVINPPPTVGDVANPPIFMVVYAAMGADASFQDMSPWRFVPESEVVVAEAEAAPREDFAKAFPSLAPGCVTVDEGDVFFPDMFTKVSDLTRMWQAWPSVPPNNNTVYAAQGRMTFSLLPQLMPPDPVAPATPFVRLQYKKTTPVDTLLPTMPVQNRDAASEWDPLGTRYKSIDVGFALAQTATYDSAGGGYRRWTLADHFAHLYRFQRGSGRLRWYGYSTGRAILTVLPAGWATNYGTAGLEQGTLDRPVYMADITPCGQPALLQSGTAFVIDPGLADFNPFQIEAPPVRVAQNGTDAAITTPLSKLEVDVPWRGQQPFCTTGAPAETPNTFDLTPNDLSLALPEVGYNVFAQFNVGGQGSAGLVQTGQFYRAMGDDHRFYFLRGPPPCFILCEPFVAVSTGGNIPQSMTQSLTGAYATQPGAGADYFQELWQSIILNTATAG